MQRLTIDIPTPISRAARPARRGLPVLLSLVLGLFGGGCHKKDHWVVGSWVMVDPAGKPGPCRTFAEDRTFTIHATPSCKGKSEAIPGGRWQLKAQDKLAVQNSGDSAARLAHIGQRDEHHFVARGALAGTFYRVGDKGAEALLAALERKGVFKVKPLPAELGCAQLSRGIDAIRAMEAEPNPRMLRANDQGLQYHRERPSDPTVAKVVYALNQDQLDWLAFHLAAAAFSGGGPAQRLARALGTPEASVATGKGSKRQQISMWRAYCRGKGAKVERDVDVTLFSQPGEKSGYFYVSEGVVSQTWADIKQMASDPALADDGEDEGEAKGSRQPPAKPRPAPPAPAKQKPKVTSEDKPEPPPAPAVKPAAPERERAAEPPPTPPKVAESTKAPKAAEAPKAAKVRPTTGGPATIGPGGRPMVPGREDEI